jgi:hypothetical protein
MKNFWKKFKKIIRRIMNSPFYWYIGAATLNVICAGLWFYQKKILLAILWSLSTIGQARNAWLYREFR